MKEEKKQLPQEDFFVDINDEEEVFVFESFWNKMRPEDKQMKAYIKPLSGKDLANISVQIRKDIAEYKKANPDDESEFVDLYNMFSEKWEFKYRIERLENVKLKVKGEVVDLTDPVMLFEYPNSKMARLASELQVRFIQIDTLNLKN